MSEVDSPNERTLGGGRYRLKDRIGAKDHTETYKAIDERGTLSAVELTRMAAPEDAALLDRWAERMSRFDHPDLPHVYGYGAEGRSFYVVREYVEGINLKTLLAGGPLPVRRATRYAIQICQALHAANRMGIVHGDLRPHNIVVTEDDRVKVMEFQMPPARGALGARTTRAPELWHYASPEEIQGLQLTPASDVYSMGVVLYEMLTGRVPFDGVAVEQVQHLHLTEAPRSPRALGVKLPAQLERIILRALAKDPATRYQGPESMRIELSRALAALETPAARASATAQVAPPAAAAAPAPTRIGEPTVTPVVEPAVEPAVEPRMPAAAPAPARLAPVAAPRRRIWPWVLTAVLLAVALAAAVATQLLPAPVAVPDLAGLSRADAQAAIAAAGLVLGEIANEPAQAERVGTVISQNPRAQVRVRRGTAVDLTVGAARSIAAPDLTGRTQAEAVTAIQSAGLAVGPVTFEYTNTAPEGTVIGQSPGAGRILAPDDAVDLTVARALLPVVIPSVVGLSEDTAVSRLQDAGFSVITTREFSETIANGWVVRQVPDAGTSVGPGSALTVVVSTGKRLIEVPDVVGLDREDAVGALTRIGFDVHVSFEETRSSLLGKVLSQYPESGRTISPATRVELTVGD